MNKIYKNNNKPLNITKINSLKNINKKIWEVHPQSKT